MEDVDRGDRALGMTGAVARPAAELAHVVVAADLEHVAADVAAAISGGAAVPAQEVLDVVTVDREPRSIP